MLGAFSVASVALLLNGEFNSELLQISTTNWIYLGILGVVCTTLAFLLSVWVMKFVSPFTVSISINMEPIYTIIIAIILNPFKEQMSTGFYVGGSIIIASIFINAYLKKRKRKKITN
jgi:drug/metabolite transporter (DMT)-like permease